jgi:hypothetical protein
LDNGAANATLRTQHGGVRILLSSLNRIGFVPSALFAEEFSKQSQAA